MPNKPQKALKLDASKSKRVASKSKRVGSKMSAKKQMR